MSVRKQVFVGVFLLAAACAAPMQDESARAPKPTGSADTMNSADTPTAEARRMPEPTPKISAIRDPERDETALAPAVPVDPSILVGLSEDQTEFLLGDPQLVREQPPAVVWVYRADECRIDLFFYRDVATRELRSLAFEVVPQSTSSEGDRACFELVWRSYHGR